MNSLTCFAILQHGHYYCATEIYTQAIDGPCDLQSRFPIIIASRYPNRAALEKAKKNVIENHAVVGIAEDMESFTRALEFLMPRYFKGMHSIYTGLEGNVDKACLSLTLPYKNSFCLALWVVIVRKW